MSTYAVPLTEERSHENLALIIEVANQLRMSYPEMVDTRKGITMACKTADFNRLQSSMSPLDFIHWVERAEAALFPADQGD